MKNYSESERWMKDAKDCFQHMRDCFQSKYWRGIIQNAQLAIELSIKALIALFEEPDWTHNPGEQLIRLTSDRKDEIKERFGQHMVDALTKAAGDAKIAGPWHGWSVYGKAKENSTGWMPAVDLCTADVAEDLMRRAERTIATIERFLQLAVPGSESPGT